MCAVAAGKDLVVLAIENEAEGIPVNSLSLPEIPEIGEPPESVTKAGKEFVDAWKLYHSVTVVRPRDPKASSPRDGGKDQINAYKERELFDDLLTRTVTANPPPAVSEYKRSTYSSLHWCGDGAMTFASRYQNGLSLAMLRNGKPFDALQLMVSSGSAKADLLLPAFGAETETFRIGEWLAKGTLPERICKTGGEKTARMIMDWIDLNFDAEQKRRKIQRETNRYDMPKNEPYFPLTDITQFLRPDCGVTDKTKTRIVGFVEAKGLKAAPVGSWLYSAPKASAKWLVPLARIGLNNPLNSIKKRSSAILKAAGVEHASPELRPDPRFQVLVNGQKWPGSLGSSADLSLSIDAEKSSSAEPLKDFTDGIATLDADDFLRNGKIKKVEVYWYPYVWGRIDLPGVFSKIGVVRIEARELKISPVFPDRPTTPEDRTYAVELDRFSEGHVPDGSTSRRIMKNHNPCVYPNVSPGKYWIRVRHPGAALEDRQKITIKNDGKILTPVLRKGSSIVVPVVWLELSNPESLPPELGRLFVGYGSDRHQSLRSVIKIEGKGVWQKQEYIATPEAAEGRFLNSVIFPYLPSGKYTIESPPLRIKPSSIHPGCVILSSSIEVEIWDDSPVFVITKPLEVLYDEKK